MSEEDKELAKQCVNLRFSAFATAALLGSTSTTCSTYQADQISYLSRLLSELGKPNQSTADRLVSTFSERKDVCWLMVTFNPEEGLLLQATAKDRQKLLRLNRNDVEYTKFEKLHSDNKLTGRQKLLLIFMFASVEETRLLYMHPEAISCDVTFGTENTKKQLFDFAKERQKILVNSLEQAHGLLSAVVASLPENRKCDSIIAFPVTGKSKQQREKRKKNRGGH
ncbi:hypothetical protein IV203_038277 [Nitzschia inconspicua]|uniref:Uncharacterized protein n=1 Tax=Nitzschia inconspicua TaxID=303405 RepID=A0A9K3LMA9_9STRA|nr:hypothetical protein IV203_038277 [Nitzschia inconspicua]